MDQYEGRCPDCGVAYVGSRRPEVIKFFSQHLTKDHGLSDDEALKIAKAKVNPELAPRWRRRST